MKCWHGVQDLNFTLMVFQCLRLLQAYYCLNFRLCMNHFLGVFSQTSIIVLLSQFLRSSLHDTLLQALVSAPIPRGVSPLAFSKSPISCVFLLFFSLLFFISRTMLLISFPSFEQITYDVRVWRPDSTISLEMMLPTAFYCTERPSSTLLCSLLNFNPLWILTHLHNRSSPNNDSPSSPGVRWPQITLQVIFERV